MTAPDAPFDPHTASGRRSGETQRKGNQGTRALSTPCVSGTIAQRMAAGTLSSAELRCEGRSLVLHLLGGCPDCAVTFGLAAGLPEVTHKLHDFHYDVPVKRGLRRTMEDWRAAVAAGTTLTTKESYERERAKALIAEARKLRRDDPEVAMELLDEALRRATMADSDFADGEAAAEGISCEIHTERANLFRLLGRYPEAEFAFQTALGCRQEGVGAAEQLLNLGDQYGSFLIDRRRFGEADGMLARLVVLLAQRGSVAQAGRLTIKRSLAAAYSGDPGRALHLAYEALRLLNGTDETLELRLNALQLSIAWNVELGNFQEASACSEAIRTEYHRHMGESDWAKFRWLDAQTYDGFGQRGLAERLFQRVKAQFEQLGLPFQAALVGLDLAMRLVERGRSGEARQLIAEELIPTFRSVGVAREGLASLVLLERATEAAALDAALLKSVLRDLERAGQGSGPARREDGTDDEASDFE